ncbi:VOC family protein [soil metagenome]
MPSPTAYLQFDGSCAEALTFYAEALGGRVLMMSKYSDAPPNTGMPPVPAHWVMHGRLEWPGGGMLMGSDGGMAPYAGVKGMSLCINCTDVAEGRRVFEALAVGGTVKVPFGVSFWSPGFGMLVDRFAVPWMVNVDAPISH